MNVQQPAPRSPGFDAQDLAAYASFAALIEATRPTLPCYALHPARFKVAARRFIDTFPGTTMYAVKANPAATVAA